MLIDEGMVEKYPDPIYPIVIDDSDCNEINANTRDITVEGIVLENNIEPIE